VLRSPEKVEPEENEDWLASNVVQLDRCEYKTYIVTDLLLCALEAYVLNYLLT